jgi:phosphoenolpyruvate carboxylase
MRCVGAFAAGYNGSVHPPASLLAADLDRLGTDLTLATRELSGDRMADLVHSLRDEAVELRAGTLPGGRAALAARIAALPLEDIEDVARAYTHWCHLMNSAEEQQRIRVLRGREDTGEGVAGAVRAMRDAGMTADDVAALFERALVMPVLTAHPTESRRRSILDHLLAIATLLDELERPLGGPARKDAEDELSAEVLALLGTEEARVRRPTPVDEIEAAVEVFRRTLFEVTADVYADLEDALAEVWPERTWRLPAFFRWGTWVGGDRDGNPNVTAHVTRTVFERQRAAVLARYLQDTHDLGRALSVASLRGAEPAGAAELEHSLERDRARMPEVAARARPRTVHEPWREKLWYVAERLRATAARTDAGYVDVNGYLRDLGLIERTLAAAGFARLARSYLRPRIRRAEVFGFHLATVDIRQHSGVHEAVVDELLAAAGRPGYAKLDEGGRRRVLGEVLARPIQPIWDRTTLSEQTQDLLATLDMVGRACRELGERACERYVVSFTNNLSDLLEVVFLTRSAGLAPGELRPVPLLEQLEDLQRAGELARELLAHPILRDEIYGELEVMIGYSDSGKQVGVVAAQVALRKAQLELAAIAAGAGVTLTVFHGRGGAIGRGGGPSGEAIRAQPAAALRGRVRVTEQGETITSRYARTEIAHRDLELTLGAVLRSAADERHDGEARVDRELDVAAGAALEAYQRLTADKDRLARYTLAATPIQHVGRLPIGSRPASRKAGFSLDDLRAIPWVFSWNQSRHGLPGWYGVGSGLEALIAKVGVERVRELLGRSRFLRALVHNAEMALIRADIDVAREYASLADPDAAQLFAIIEDEHTRTSRVLATLDLDIRRTDRPYLAESVRRRNPYIDVLSHSQVELLRRFRAAEARGAAAEELEQLSTAIFTTISGIAAGLQTAG